MSSRVKFVLFVAALSSAIAINLNKYGIWTAFVLINPSAVNSGLREVKPIIIVTLLIVLPYMLPILTDLWVPKALKVMRVMASIVLLVTALLSSFIFIPEMVVFPYSADPHKILQLSTLAITTIAPLLAAVVLLWQDVRRRFLTRA